MLRSAKAMSIARWVRRALFGGVFGVVVTVALAWYFAVVGGTAPKAAVRTVGIVRGGTPGVLVRVFDERRGPGYHLRLASGINTSVAPAARPGVADAFVERPGWLPADFGVDDTLREEHVGWPLLALKSGYGTRSPSSGPGREIRYPAMSFPTATTTYTLPLSPIWSGFLVNVGVFGAAYVGVAGAVALARRGGAGRCVRCRYSLSGLPEGAVCPECGAAQRSSEGPAPA